MIRTATIPLVLFVLLVAPVDHGSADSAPGDSAAGGPTRQWPQWGGSPERNNTPVGTGIPTDWEVGRFDRKTGQWLADRARNVKWVASVGKQSYGTPVIAGGKIFIGANNGSGYLKRYPAKVDLGCLLCFRQSDGEFLWQHSSKKVPNTPGRIYDWPDQGVCCAPLVEGERLWFVSNRGCVVCLDTEGYRDGEDDGPVKAEPELATPREADTVWSLDMMKELGIAQHNMCSCSVTAHGDVLFVATSNGVDESHDDLPAPEAPSFIALDKRTGDVLWTDNSPGANILHGQWSSPAIGVFDGVPQVMFAGGDGWLYSFKADAGTGGKPELLWKFDCNPKTTKWAPGGRGTRNSIIATPVVCDGAVYMAVGQDPEHGEGQGHLWCIDPTRRGDVSAELAVRKGAPATRTRLPVRRIQAVIEEDGEMAVPNPNSAALWHYDRVDGDGDGEFDFTETMHRAVGSPAVKDGLVFIADFSGLFHCVDAKTGKPLWTYDMLASAWGSPLIVDGKVYIGDEDGDVAIFELSREPQEPIEEINVANSMYGAPIVVDNVLYIPTKSHLFAIEAK